MEDNETSHILHAPIMFYNVLKTILKENIRKE